MISCLCITQPSRLALVTVAMGDFARQTVADAELLLVHGGDADFDAHLRDLAAQHRQSRIRVHRAPADLGLGMLRDLSVQHAQGELICQWDDDDRNHPLRLALQLGELSARRADFCFLSDQLHWFPLQRELFWDDWSIDPYPLDFVQGTLFGRKDAMPRYPDLDRGEDTEIVLRIMRARSSIARLRDRGWAYVYVYHGANVFPAAHHAAISHCKRYSGARLLAREKLLRERLAEYTPPLGVLRMPWTGGAITFD